MAIWAPFQQNHSDKRETLNPAILLRIQNFVNSFKAGQPCYISFSDFIEQIMKLRNMFVMLTMYICKRLHQFLLHPILIRLILSNITNQNKSGLKLVKNVSESSSNFWKYSRIKLSNPTIASSKLKVVLKIYNFYSCTSINLTCENIPGY